MRRLYRLHRLHYTVLVNRLPESIPAFDILIKRRGIDPVMIELKFDIRHSVAGPPDSGGRATTPLFESLMSTGGEFHLDNNLRGCHKL